MAHLRLSYGCVSGRYEPIRTVRSSVKVNCCSSRLRFGAWRRRKNFSRFDCFAAFDGDDVREKQPEIGTSNSGTGGVGSALEDRPGMI